MGRRRMAGDAGRPGRWGRAAWAMGAGAGGAAWEMWRGRRPVLAGEGKEGEGRGRGSPAPPRAAASPPRPARALFASGAVERNQPKTERQSKEFWKSARSVPRLLPISRSNVYDHPNARTQLHNSTPQSPHPNTAEWVGEGGTVLTVAAARERRAPRHGPAQWAARWWRPLRPLDLARVRADPGGGWPDGRRWILLPLLEVFLVPPWVRAEAAS